jgi:hypothetical protein
VKEKRASSMSDTPNPLVEDALRNLSNGDDPMARPASVELHNLKNLPTNQKLNGGGNGTREGAVVQTFDGIESAAASANVKDEIGPANETEEDEGDTPWVIPNMWERKNVGLYCQYAAVGLVTGSASTLMQFCVYVKDGEPNVCSNASNIVFFAWNFKLVFAIVTDMYWPFGYRKKSWMLFGWSMTLLMLLLLAIIPSKSLDTSSWLSMLLVSQIFMMFSDVPADGYSVELGQMEPKKQRGQILATGQRIRFMMSACSGLIQMFLLNGPSTNAPGADNVWSWGLNINQYYGLIFAITFVLVIPLVFLEEVKKVNKYTGEVAPPMPPHTLSHFLTELWTVLQNQTSMYLLIYVIMFHSVGSITNQANVYLQFYIIQLTGFQTGIDGVSSMAALVFAIWLFQTYLIKKNWRITQVCSATFAIVLGFMWIPAYHNSGGTMNAWYTIFIDLDSTFVAGIAQVLYSLSVIELAKPGIEATTYELIITVGNACITVSGILGTQFLLPTNAVACERATYQECPNDAVSINTGKAGFIGTGGPKKFTQYNLLISFISLVNSWIWVWWLPSSVEECAVWKKKGEENGLSARRGFFNLFMCVAVITYVSFCYTIVFPFFSCL